VQWSGLFVAAWLAATISGAAGFGGALLLLPVVTSAVGAKAAVPILTVAQLMGNLSRAGFGHPEIRWRPVWYFVAGAVPASVAGSRLFVSLPKEYVTAGIGVLLILIVVARRLRLLAMSVPEKSLALGGAAVGFVSAMAGSAGPLGAALFLGLNLPPAAYVASEAVTAVAMHITKLVVYGRYSLINPSDLALGAFLGGAMVLGSWTGKKILQILPRDKFLVLVEALMVLSALQLIFSR
jgi:hypothetical protein